jgi:hypothetical protein
MSEPRIIRVFPRRVPSATPDDALTVCGRGPEVLDYADEVHVSVTFEWDIPKAHELAEAWQCVAPVRIGGPATGEPGGTFVPGRYLRHGYVITSRGCPNRCWFCSVWLREGETVRELPIVDGWNVLDDNLLACSDAHIRAVFAMLKRVKRARHVRAQFTGGLEAARLKAWHVTALRELRPKQMFFAYDTPDDLAPLRDAGSMLLASGFTRRSHTLRCYVLCGWPKDRLEEANRRMVEAQEAGFTPMAMLMRDKHGHKPDGWAGFAKHWARPAIIHAANKRKAP